VVVSVHVSATLRVCVCVCVCVCVRACAACVLRVCTILRAPCQQEGIIVVVGYNTTVIDSSD
jgi:hypothetical protein